MFDPTAQPGDGDPSLHENGPHERGPGQIMCDPYPSGWHPSFDGGAGEGNGQLPNHGWAKSMEHGGSALATGASPRRAAKVASAAIPLVIIRKVSSAPSARFTNTTARYRALDHDYGQTPSVPPGPPQKMSSEQRLQSGSKHNRSCPSESIRKISNNTVELADDVVHSTPRSRFRRPMHLNPERIKRD
jgi:hypothetical protein